MSKVFSRFKARDYEFRNDDGTTDRKVIVIYAGTQRVGFLEYEHARRFVDVIHDLTDQYEQQQREAANNE